MEEFRCSKCQSRFERVLVTPYHKYVRKNGTQVQLYRCRNCMKEHMHKYLHKYTSKRNAALKRYALRNPEKVAARYEVFNALRTGNLVKSPCIDCGGKAQAHHHDYSKPLEVEWLCASCHALLHKKERILCQS